MLLSAGTPKLPLSQRLAWLAVLLPMLVALVFLIRMPLSWIDQAIFSALIIFTCMVTGRLSSSRYVTSLLTIISIFCTLRYAIWRWSSSISYLNNSGWHVEWVGLAFALMLLSAETYSVIILLLGYFQSSRPLRRKPMPMPSDINEWPTVDIYVPTYNEPLDVVRPTVLAAMEIDWPRDKVKVYILDDGRREEFRRFAEECGSGYLTRTDNKHAKAGNINAAMKKTSGEYIAIFDCDHIATRSFLQLTMGWFGKDEKLALVQTPHHFYSPDPFERNLDLFRKIPNEGALFYGVVQDGNDLWNATFFCGSCAVIKRAALEPIGGIAVETVTEDAHTALRLQRLGWNTAYIGIPQAAGLATGSLAAHVGQRIRWARGMVQILRTECPMFVSGLNLSQRICYLNCVLHYLYAIPRLIFVSAPLVYLLLGKSNLYGFIWEILAYAAPHLVLSNMVNSRTQGDHRHSFWNEVYEMVLAPYILLPTTFALINPKWGKFNVTAKSSVVDESYFDWKIARPYIFLIFLNVAAVATAIPRYFTSGDPSGVLAINVTWALLNTLMLGACVAVSFENKQRRSTARVEASLSAKLVFGGNREYACSVIDLSEGGVALKSESVFECESGQRGAVSITAGLDEFRFAVQTVRSQENRVHLRFLENNLNHQRDITKLVYARADSWIDWNKDQKRDRILNSLMHVFRIGAHGVWMLPSFFIKRESKSARPVDRKTLPKTVLPLLFLTAVLGWSPRAKAQELPAVPSAPKTQNAATFQEHQSFSDLGLKTAMILNAEHPRATLNFVMLGTKIVESADLALNYRSGEVRSNESLELAVSLNNVEIAAVPVSKSAGTVEPAHVVIPSDLLVHDNALTFEFRRQCPNPCEKPGKPIAEWIRLEPMSDLQTTGLVLSLPNRLSMLPSPFFDPSLQRSVELPFVFEAQPDLASLKAAGILASWYGSLTAHRGSHFLTSFGQFPKGNVILVAHSDTPLAASIGLTAGVSQVAICDNPSDRFGKVLAIVAPSSETLPRLAALVAGNRVHSEDERAVISAAALANEDQPSVLRPKWSDASHPIRLLQTTGESPLHARIGAPGTMYFRVAPDLDYGSRLTVPLHLSFRLSGLATDDHVWVGIRLNNIFVSKRRMSMQDAGNVREESFAIPVALLYSSNTLDVDLMTDRSETVVSDPRSVDLQVMSATNLDLGNPTHFVQMPRLDLFAASGFPFTARPDLAETTVILPEYPTGAQIGLYLDAIGFLSAQTEVAGTRFTLGNVKDLRAGTSNNILVIAGADDDETSRPFQRSMVILPANGKFEAGELSLSPREWISRAWLGRRDELAKLSQLLDRESSLRFMVEQFKSPYRSDRSVLVLATRSETDSSAYFDALTKASREGSISGGLTLSDGEHFTSFKLAPISYALGAQASRAAIYGWLRFHLWIIPIFLLVAAALLAAWWESLLARQAEGRLKAAA